MQQIDLVRYVLQQPYSRDVICSMLGLNKAVSLSDHSMHKDAWVLMGPDSVEVVSDHSMQRHTWVLMGHGSVEVLSGHSMQRHTWVLMGMDSVEVLSGHSMQRHTWVLMGLTQWKCYQVIPFGWSNIREIVPFFPFVLCISVCTHSNAHAYTVFSAFFTFVWHNLTSAWPSECRDTLGSWWDMAQWKCYLVIPCRDTLCFLMGHDSVEELKRLSYWSGWKYCKDLDLKI